MANIDISLPYVPGSQTAVCNFQYDPPPSIAGKICKCWVSGLFTDENNLNSFMVKASWSQVNSVRVHIERGTYNTATATGTNGTNELTYTYNALKVGDYLSGTGITLGTYITSIDTATKKLVLSSNLTSAGSGTYWGWSNLNANINMNSSFADVNGNSDIISFTSDMNSSYEHAFAYVRIPDGPHQVSITFYSEWLPSNIGKHIYGRIHLEPMDNNYHYDRLTSNKTGPSIII